MKMGLPLPSWFSAHYDAAIITMWEQSCWNCHRGSRFWDVLEPPHCDLTGKIVIIYNGIIKDCPIVPIKRHLSSSWIFISKWKKHVMEKNVYQLSLTIPMYPNISYPQWFTHFTQMSWRFFTFKIILAWGSGLTKPSWIMLRLTWNNLIICPIGYFIIKIDCIISSNLDIYIIKNWYHWYVSCYCQYWFMLSINIYRL